MKSWLNFRSAGNKAAYSRLAEHIRPGSIAPRNWQTWLALCSTLPFCFSYLSSICSPSLSTIICENSLFTLSIMHTYTKFSIGIRYSFSLSLSFSLYLSVLHSVLCYSFNGLVVFIRHERKRGIEFEFTSRNIANRLD